jgi:hypothetical protein
MKNKSLGWPSSASRNNGLEKEENNCISLLDATIERFLK